MSSSTPLNSAEKRDQALDYLKSLQVQGVDLNKIHAILTTHPEVDSFVKTILNIADHPQKSKNQHYQNLLKSFENGSIGKLSDFQTFATALDNVSTPKRREKAQEIVSKLAVSKITPANLTHKLTEIQNALDEDHEEIKHVKKAEDLIYEIRNRSKEEVEEVYEDNKTIKEHIKSLKNEILKITNKKNTSSNWQGEKLPREKINQLEQNIDFQEECLKKYKEIFTEIRFLKSKPETPPIIAEIAAKNAELIELNKLIDKNTEALSNDLEFYDEYMTRYRLQFQQINNANQKTGLDLINAKKLYVYDWTGHTKTDNNTGNNRPQKIKEIEIQTISFELDEEEKKYFSTYYPGEMKVTFIDENKQTQTLPFRFFKNKYLDNGEAFEERSLSEISETLKSSLLFQNLAPKQKFFTTTKELNEKGELVDKQTFFEITDIVEENGKTKIIIDQPVTKITSNELANNVRSDEIFDRKQKIFTPGEFERLIKLRNYKRVLNPEEDVEEIKSKLDSDRLEKYKEFHAKNNGLDLSKPQDQEKFKELQAQGVIPKDDVLIKQDDRRNRLEINKLNENGELETIDINGHSQSEADPSDIINAYMPDIDEKEKIKRLSDELLSDDELIAPQSSVEKIDEFIKEKEKGMIAQLWADTTFVSLSDIWEIFKTMKEYIKSRLMVRQKMRIGSIGKPLPYFGEEFKKQETAGISEYFDKIKNYLGKSGPDEIIEVARNPKDMVYLKVAITLLCEKGLMPWDDIEIWKAINRFAAKGDRIPIPKNGDPNTKTSSGKTYKDYLGPAIDSIWGRDEYKGFKSTQTSSYVSQVDAAKRDVAEVMAENNHSEELTKLLIRHRNGEFINAHRYEAILSNAMSYGFSDTYSNVYFFIHAFATPGGPFNRPILEPWRMTNIADQNVYPILAFFKDRFTRKGGTEASTVNLEDFKLWARKFDDIDGHRPGDPSFCKPSSNVYKFVWQRVLPSVGVKGRIDRSINSAQYDYSDAALYVPRGNLTQLKTVCGVAGGDRFALQNTHYQNVLPGYNNYIKETGLIAPQDPSDLISLLDGYVHFRGIMTNRFRPSEKYYRFTDEDYRIIKGDISNGDYIRETDNLIDKVVKAYARQQGTKESLELLKSYNTIYGDPYDKRNPQKYEKQKREVDLAYEDFSRNLREVIRKDKGKLLYRIVQSSKLTGTTFTSPEELRRRKLEAQNNNNK